jgi:hypothetical protein
MGFEVGGAAERGREMVVMEPAGSVAAAVATTG